VSGVLFAVMRREYLQRVRSKWFVFATIAGPLFMVGLIVLPALLATRGQQSARTIVVQDRTGVLFERLAPRLEEGGYTVERAGDADPLALDLRVREKEVGAWLVLDDETLARARSQLRTAERPSALRALTLRQAVAQAVLEARLGETGEGIGSLLAGGDMETVVLSGEGEDLDERTFFAAYVGSFVLYMVILLYAMSIMRSVLEEKNSRVVEVVLASMRPFDLMLGKILGVGAVGLTQLAIWVASAMLIAAAAIPALLAANPELTQLAEVRDALPGAGYAALFLVFFLGGFFIYSGLYAAVGAMCNSDDEAQQAQWPVAMLLIVPIIFVVQIIQEPSSPLSVGLSLFPLFSPILMFARAVGSDVPAWQLGLSIVLMVMTVMAVAWVAGRIYKTGILMAGKRPTLPELWRWVRQA
jgi:ABC-2 type transport system permease protein